jgi:hypothetical protein
MNSLQISLKNATSYINTGNLFSRLQIIKNNLTDKKQIILIVENQKQSNQYKKLAGFLNIQYEEINTYSSLINIISGKTGLYIIHNYELKEDIIPHKQLIYKSQKITIQESYEINDIVKILAEM